MRSATPGLACLLIVVMLIAGHTTPAFADVPPPDGRKRQAQEFQFDFGPYGEVMPRAHTVAKGDTLGALAKRYLGTTTRWEEIRKANPGIDPKKLLLGSRLVIPARHAALDPKKPETKDGPRHRWDFHTFTAGWNSLELLASNGHMPCRYHFGTSLVAVRHDKRDEFARLAKDERWRAQNLSPRAEKRPAWLAVGPTAVFREVKDSDPVFRVVDRRRITAIGGGTITTERVRLDRLDGKGNVLSESEVLARKNKGAMVLIFLGLIGLVTLVHVRMRRRRGGGRRVVSTPTATTAALLLLLGLTAVPAAADIPVPGRRNITTEVTLEFGPYADYTTRVHVVKQGETAKTLPTFAVPAGMEAEAKALLEGVDMANLSPGQRIRFVPRRAPRSQTKGEAKPPAGGGAGMHWWHVYSIPSPSLELTPFAHGQKVPVQHYGAEVIAIRHDHDAAFRATWSDPKKGNYRYIRELSKSPPAWFAKANDIDVGRTSVKTASPIYRTEKVLRITGIAKGTIATKVVSVTHYGKDGSKLSASQIASANRLNLVLLLLAGGGLLGLIALLVRRRRHVVGPAAAALLLGLGVVVPTQEADADVRVGPPPTTQFVTAVVDFGGMRDQILRTARVTKGQTLKSIAKATLGSEARWTEIQALNPEAHPTELAVGYRLTLPAKAPPKEGAWRIFMVDAQQGHAREVHDGTKAAPMRSTAAALVAVRADGLKAFRTRLKEEHPSRTVKDRWRDVPKRVGFERLVAEAPAWFAWARDVKLERHGLEKQSPLRTIEHHIRLDGVSEGKLQTTLVRTRYLTPTGKEMSLEEARKHIVTRKAVFVLLGLLGAGGLAFVVLRRRAEVVPAA